jgi:hypothetical protein
MSSSQNLQPENAEDAEDVSVPTLSSDSIKLEAKISKLTFYVDRCHLLVVPPKLQTPLFRKTYRTRESGRGLGNLKGFMDLPMDVVFEVSLRSLRRCASAVDETDASKTLPDCYVSLSKGSPATFQTLEAI